jgi:membrane-associated phospholipid phosphatase
MLLVALTVYAAPCVALAAQPDELAPIPDAPPASPKPYWRTNLFGRFFRDQSFLFTTWWPAEIRRPWFTGPVLAGVVLATTSDSLTLEQMDMRFGNYTKAETAGHSRPLAYKLSFVGNTGPGMLLVGAGYLIGRWSHHQRLEEATSLSAEALLTTGLYTTILKSLTARTRPANGGTGKFFVYSPPAGQTSGSFPSGHASCAFSVAAVFSGVYSDHPWVPYVAYGTAGLIGWSRIALHRHFPSDILVGAMLGSSIGRMTLARDKEAGEATAIIEPFFDPEGHGGGLVYTRRWQAAGSVTVP